MLIYKAVNGQSLLDVCLNTYGSTDYFIKLLKDNNIANANQLPYTGQQFSWDETLVSDNNVQTSTANGDIIYATSSQSNNNTYYVVDGSIGSQPTPTPSDGSAIPIGYYEKVSETSYTATTDGESVITLASLIGKTIIEIIKEIKPMFANQWSFNTKTGVITLTSDSLSAGESLFILYKEIIKP